MMRFIIADGLPYLLHNDKTYAVRWDEKGFTVGAEVKLASVPAQTLSELSMKAKYPNSLDSIGKQEQPVETEQEEEPSQEQPVETEQEEEPSQEQPVETEQEEEPSQEQPVETDELNDMTLTELKAFAKANGVQLGYARNKADIIKVIRAVLA